MGARARIAANDDGRATIASAYALPRRGLRREEAALYVGVSPSKFDQLVQDGRMPKPIRIDGCVVWDVRVLDLAFEALSEQNAPIDDGGWGDFDGADRA